MEVIQKTEYIRAWQQQSQVISFSVAQGIAGVEEELANRQEHGVKDNRMAKDSASISNSGVHTMSFTVENDMKNNPENAPNSNEDENVMDKRNDDANKEGEKDENDEDDDNEEESQDEEVVTALPRPILRRKRRDTAYKFGPAPIDPVLFQNWRRE